MARSSLASESVRKLLAPFIITSANCGEDVSTLEPEVREIYTGSELFQDANRLNTFAFVLDHQGRLVHQFHGVPGGARGGVARSDYRAELTAALAKLALPEELTATKPQGLSALPDLPKTTSRMPAGVRLFLRAEARNLPVVEVVPMMPDQWQPLAFPAQAKEVEADSLKDWLGWLYPAAIRAADEAKRFQTFSGKLTLQPAGGEGDSRYAVLRGAIRLTKGNETESAFEGNLELVLTYRRDAPEVKSVRGIVQGHYVYRVRQTQRIALEAAVESRPE